MADEGIQINFPQADVDALFAEMNAAVTLLGKSLGDALAWTGAKLATSLKASTKVSAKIRPIVRNPNERYLTDRRVAPFGVMKYKKGELVFAPIFRTGEFGGTRFYDKKTASWFERHGPNKNTWRKVASGADPGNPELIVPGIMSDKRRVIGRSGLAKKNWATIARFVKRNGDVSTMGVAGTANMTWSGDRSVLTITNQLRYAADALKADYGTAAERAGNSLRKLINDKVEASLGAK